MMPRPWAGMEAFLVAFLVGGLVLRGWWRYLERTPQPTMRTRMLYAAATAASGVVGVVATGIEVAILAFPLVAGGVAIVFMKVPTCPHCGKVVVAERNLFRTARHCRWCSGPVDSW